jgi:hypothetical protein
MKFIIGFASIILYSAFLLLTSGCGGNTATNNTTPPVIAPPVTPVIAKIIAGNALLPENQKVSVLGLAAASAGFVYSSKRTLSETGVPIGFDLQKTMQDGLIRVIASRDNQPETGTGLSSFQEANLLSVDSKGNLFVLDEDWTSLAINQVPRGTDPVGYRPGIWKITPDNTISAFAGIFGDTHNTVPFDDTGVQARFAFLRSMVIDATDNIYVADVGRVRKISPTGEVSTLNAPTLVKALRSDANGKVYAVSHKTQASTCLDVQTLTDLDTGVMSDTPCIEGPQAWIDKTHYVIATPDKPNVLQLKTVGGDNKVILGTAGSADVTNISTLPGTLQKISAITIGPDKAVYLTAGDALIKVTGLMPLP